MNKKDEPNAKHLPFRKPSPEPETIDASSENLSLVERLKKLPKGSKIISVRMPPRKPKDADPDEES